MVVNMGEKVLFDVTSHDLTYGFGLFRKDGSMVFQMQVVPKHKNTLLWTFKECGKFDIRSTEYAGPAQYDPETGEDLMYIKGGVVVNCNDKFAMRSSNGK
jgi:cytochrome c oxidase subunit 2